MKPDNVSHFVPKCMDFSYIKYVQFAHIKSDEMQSIAIGNIFVLYGPKHLSKGRSSFANVDVWSQYHILETKKNAKDFEIAHKNTWAICNVHTILTEHVPKMQLINTVWTSWTTN